MFGLTDLCIQAEPSTNIMVTFESDDAMPQCLLLCVLCCIVFFINCVGLSIQGKLHGHLMRIVRLIHRDCNMI